ncbi:hypothetical protein ACOMHN_011059 [Nucella lapillus]
MCFNRRKINKACQQLEAESGRTERCYSFSDSPSVSTLTTAVRARTDGSRWGYTERNDSNKREPSLSMPDGTGNAANVRQHYRDHDLGTTARRHHLGIL